MTGCCLHRARGLGCRIGLMPQHFEAFAIKYLSLYGSWSTVLAQDHHYPYQGSNCERCVCSGGLPIASYGCPSREAEAIDLWCFVESPLAKPVLACASMKSSLSQDRYAGLQTRDLNDSYSMLLGICATLRVIENAHRGHICVCVCAWPCLCP